MQEQTSTEIQGTISLQRSVEEIWASTIITRMPVEIRIIPRLVVLAFCQSFSGVNVQPDSSRADFFGTLTTNFTLASLTYQRLQSKGNCEITKMRSTTLMSSRKLKSEFDAGCQGKVVRLAGPRISSCVFQQGRTCIARSILVWNLLAFQCITIV